MKISWGIKIMGLYAGFVALIITMVTLSMRQHFDLVAPDYYQQEVAYQQTIDAGKNQATLSSPILVQANAEEVRISLPNELGNNPAVAAINFYSPVNSAWDYRTNAAVSGNSVVVPRSKLRDTRYVVKIEITSDGKKYYQESEITLSAK